MSRTKHHHDAVRGQRGKASTIAFIEALAVVSAIWRIAAMKGLPPTVVERRTTYVFEEGL